MLPRSVVSWAAFSIALILGMTFSQASAQSATPILVELFTSEGCSSCPPADALLRTLDSSQPVADAQLIVLGEHVDYWDDLGWRDPNSSHAFTTRQQNYATRLGLASAYTPQMVVDGNWQCVGSNRALADQAFEKARTARKIGLRLSRAVVDGNNITAHIEVDSAPAKSDLFVALALDHAQSQVLRGENGGHRLEHVAVVKKLIKVGGLGKTESLSRDISVKADPSTESYRLVAFVQESDQGHVLGAAVAHVGK
jgi:hypothetical protein